MCILSHAKIEWMHLMKNLRIKAIATIHAGEYVYYVFVYKY